MGEAAKPSQPDTNTVPNSCLIDPRVFFLSFSFLGVLRHAAVHAPRVFFWGNRERERGKGGKSLWESCAQMCVCLCEAEDDAIDSYDFLSMDTWL